MEGVIPSTNFIILLAFASLPLASPFYILNYTRFSCNGASSTNLSATNSSAYPSDDGLDALLSGLPSTGFTNYTTTGSVYGLALCRGDVPSSDCTNCVSTAIASLRSECPSKNEAIVWREWCTVRYSVDRYIFSTLDVDPNVTLHNENNVSGRAWTEKLNGTLSNVTAMAAAAAGGKKFATGETVFTSETNIYALAECTPDLTVADCKECFRVAKGLLSVTGEGSIALLPSCTLRYEMYPFYFNGTETYSPAPLPSLAPENASGGNRRVSYSKAVAATLALLALVMVLLVSMFVIYLHRQKNKKPAAPARVLSFELSSVHPIEYDLPALEKATQGFFEDNKIGEGGFGVVYKGVLSNGRKIAVKMLNKRGEDFKNEVVSLAKVHHRNLVRLLGYCLTPKESFLVYEYVPNHNLCHFLLDQTMREQLDWPKRFIIIKGIADGMQYLHEGSRTTIIHRDLKPSNILLDTNMNPKIGDFGLAKIFAGDHTHETAENNAGTRGYMAPEYVNRGHYCMGSDVYSFGVMVLEIVTGKLLNKFPQIGSTTDLLSYAWENWTKGTLRALLDSALTDISNFSSDQVIRCIEIGLHCIQDKENRPPMSKIVRLLDPSTPNNLPGLQPPQFFLCAMSNQPRPGLESDQAANPQAQISINGVTITELEPR